MLFEKTECVGLPVHASLVILGQFLLIFYLLLVWMIQLVSMTIKYHTASIVS